MAAFTCMPAPKSASPSTKAFTSQVTVLALFALFMGRIRMLSPQEGTRLLRALEEIPAQLDRIWNRTKPFGASPLNTSTPRISSSLDAT